MCSKLYQSIKKSSNVFFPPAAGYSFLPLIKLLMHNKVEFRYWHRAIIIGLISGIGIPFRIYENLKYNKKIKSFKITEDPIFILGHWRSGTTYLHNILCQDQNMGYVTTYQSVFPKILMIKAGRAVFRTFMKIIIPKNRKGDRVKLNADFPQEEEFIFGSKYLLCFYYFWFFPEKIIEFYKNNILFRNVDTKKIITWEQEYKRIIKKALINTSGTRFISKNPPNTARVKQLLKLFPNAKFIHIHRNPVTVILSTRNFFKKMMPYLQLQRISEEKIEEHIFEIYQKMMLQFFNDQSIIPQANLLEIKFEDLEKSPLKEIQKVYDHFGIPGFSVAKESFIPYIKSKKGYRKNAFCISRSELETILENCKFTMDKWGYGVPDDLEILPM